MFDSLSGSMSDNSLRQKALDMGFSVIDVEKTDFATLVAMTEGDYP